MTVLILDSCRVILSREPLADGSIRMHGLNVPKVQKDTKDTVVAHACAPTEEASDSG